MMLREFLRNGQEARSLVSYAYDIRRNDLAPYTWPP